MSKKTGSPFIDWHLGRKEWDDRLLALSANAKSWRLAFFAVLLATFVMALGAWHIGSQSKIEPYLTTADPATFRVVAARPLDAASSETKRIVDAWVRKEIHEFLANARTVVADGLAQKDLINKTYSRVASGSAAEKALANWYSVSGRDPFNYARYATVQVERYASLPLSNKTWQIEWREVSRNLAGEVVGVPTRWKAVFNYVVQPPADDKEQDKNPIGFYVTGIAWSQLQE